MRIDHKFTSQKSSPYDNQGWRTAVSEIRNPNGSIVFHMDTVEVPENWSQVATDIIAQKYFRKAGVPQALNLLKKKTSQAGFGARKLTLTP